MLIPWHDFSVHDRTPPGDGILPIPQIFVNMRAFMPGSRVEFTGT